MKLFQYVYEFIDRVKARFVNKYQFKKGYITKIEYELRKEFLKSAEQFGANNFYQNYPPLRISGGRSSLCRFKVYEMEKWLNKDVEILDVGGNIGFFSLYLSRFVKSITIVEQNHRLLNVGRKLADYEKIGNVKFIEKDFKKFTTDKKFDVVMSLAIHKWVGMEFEDYLKKIHGLLKKGGLVLMESHLIYGKTGDLIKDKLSKSKLFEIVEEGAIDDHGGNYREFYWIRVR